MHETSFEEKVETFWADCDAWVNDRQHEVLNSSAKLAEAKLKVE
jgi:hypothetical protein